MVKSHGMGDHKTYIKSSPNNGLYSVFRDIGHGELVFDICRIPSEVPVHMECNNTGGIV